MKNWFLSLAPRERVMVAAAAIAILVALFYTAVWQPLHRGAVDYEQRIERQRELAVHVATLGAQAAQLRARSQGNFRGQNDSLLAIIDRSSREAGVRGAIQRIQPEGPNKAAVTMTGGSFNALIQWLRQLQQSYGITISALNVVRGESNGRIEARMTLERTAG